MIALSRPRFYLSLAFVTLALASTGCEKKTPAEKMGDKIEDIGDKAEDVADKADDKLTK